MAGVAGDDAVTGGSYRLLLPQHDDGHQHRRAPRDQWGRHTPYVSAVSLTQYKRFASVRPTIMCTVPLILDRVAKSVRAGVAKRGAVFSRVFQFCYDYALSWNKEGYTTPLVRIHIV